MREPASSIGTAFAIGNVVATLFAGNGQRISALIQSPSFPLNLGYGVNAVASVSAPFVPGAGSLTESQWKGPITAIAPGGNTIIYITELS